MLILRFRQKPIAVISDIVKEYELKTVTFGTAAAPFLAIRTLVQLASDEERTHPAWCVRAISKIKPNQLQLPIGELIEAEVLVIKAVQYDNFSEELQLLSKNHPLKKGPLAMYAPYVDEATGLLRVGGRLDYADLPYDQNIQ